MTKKFLSLLLILPLLAYGCVKPDPNQNEDPNGNNTEQPDDNNNNQDPDPTPVPVEDYENAAPEVKDGDVVAATNPLVEVFINEVHYPTLKEDKTYTKIFDYYGGFGGPASPDGVTLNWSTWSKNWPDGDRPLVYSIRWKAADMEDGDMTLHLEDQLGWKGDWTVADGSYYMDITNLVPNDKYTYKVTTVSGKVLTQGSFSTTGNLHQCFFRANKKGTAGVRNCRDLGGWKTTGGKMIKYRKVYRGGRMNDPWETMLNTTGKKEVLFEGIGAQLELRGSDDFVTNPAVAELDHCAPCIEEGGKVMLGVTKPSAKNCIKWLVLDPSSPWTEEQRAPYRETTSHGYGYKLSSDAVNAITPTLTDQDYAAFQEAYKAKTRQCFEFVVNSVKNNKPVYFHCSLGRDRTGTMAVMILGILGIPEGDIAKDIELTYFAPVGYSVSSSDKENNPEPIYKNTRLNWVYSEIVPYFWSLATGDDFSSGVEKYLVEIAGVSPSLIQEFRSLMLQ